MEKKLKIFDALEELFNMDTLQLVAAKKQFNWKYLRQAKEELEEYLKNLDKEKEVC